MSDDRKRIADLFGVLARTCAEICVVMGGNPNLASATGGNAAPDRDLDSQWGDEQIKKDPPRWKKAGGASYEGSHMSECDPEFLDVLAEFKEWTAGQNDEKAHGNGPDGAKFAKYAGYDRKSAARARGWAARLRSGWTAPARDDTPPSGGFDGGAAPSGGFDGGSFDPDGFGES